MEDVPEQLEAEQPREAVPPHAQWMGLREERVDIGQTCWNACKILLVLLFLCGVLFPLVVDMIGQAVFPFQANGSLLLNQRHQVVGSRLLGQSFTRPEYFHGRMQKVPHPIIKLLRFLSLWPMLMRLHNEAFRM